MQKILFTLGGKVLRGGRVGRKLGFPTANIDRREYARKKLRIPFGVYAGTATILGKKKVYRAGIVIGPVDRKGLPKIEAHLLGFLGTLYGERVRLSLMRYLRNYKIFKNKEALKRAISKDMEKVRAAISLDRPGRKRKSIATR